MSDRPETTPSLVEETLDEHRECLQLITEVEQCLDRPPDDRQRWLADLKATLARLATALRRHFEGEESGPIFRSLPLQHPRLARPLARLEAEHPVMLERMDDVLHKAEALENTEIFELRELNGRVQLLLAQIRRHEAAEDELVIRAHCEEVGVGD
jgi:hemerythrin-like domain-containing protein